jgi:CHAT domain-containing protein
LGVAPLRYPAATRLAALPGSDQSIRELQSYFSSSDSYVGAAASKSTFLQEFSKYRIIQLYTHASDNVEGEPAIYFADSVLNLSEISSVDKLAASLIVLSACETGTGELHRGEGVFSFNRAFAAIGIPSAITNLWSIDNESTYKLTGLFYKYLSKGRPFDIALQQAKLEFIKTGSKQQSLPYYWAPAILAGKTGVLPPERSFPWKWVFPGTILILAGALYWYKRIRA